MNIMDILPFVPRAPSTNEAPGVGNMGIWTPVVKSAGIREGRCKEKSTNQRMERTRARIGLRFDPGKSNTRLAD